METTFEHFADNSKVWIYQSTTKIEESAEQEINTVLENFCDNWMSHGNKMKAYAKVFYQHFIIFFVDESKAEVSGCGIDKSVHIIKSIEQQFNLNLFDRLKVAFLNKNNEIEIAAKSKIAISLIQNKIDENTLIFNTLCNDKQSFTSNFKIALKESWLKGLLVEV